MINVPSCFLKYWCSITDPSFPRTNILILSQLKIRNDFDPVLSPESSLFVLKSNKQVVHYHDLVEDYIPWFAVTFYYECQACIYFREKQCTHRSACWNVHTMGLGFKLFLIAIIASLTFLVLLWEIPCYTHEGLVYFIHGILSKLLIEKLRLIIHLKWF